MNADSPWDKEPTTIPTLPTLPTLPTKPRAAVKTTQDPLYDLEGLMTDFPTAKELERFVYDQTGVILNLKGRANKLKYDTALTVLNGGTVHESLLATDNPYIDKAEMVPVNPLKDPPARDATLPDPGTLQNSFHSRVVPHPDFDYRARDKKVDVTFRKYANGMISYEVLGPIEEKPIGMKIDKFGRERPELIDWTDPRTGEQVIQRADGTITSQGKKLRAMMQSMKVNNSNYWATWIDRELASITNTSLNNPWADD
jgi:hypothetical protein